MIPFSKPADRSRLDWLVVTAANREQARGYRAQLRCRSLPVSGWSVLPDPGDRRAGSGTATLLALAHLAREFSGQRPGTRNFEELFEGKRAVIVHSGGDSRRLCAYAAQGKLFLPLPCSLPDGGQATLFDLILKSLSELPSPPGGHVLIASGDVLLDFNPDEVDFRGAGVTGVAYQTSLERGRRHGVYVASRGGKVADYLQKPDEATARGCGAVDSVGRVLVDTGLVSLDPGAVARLLRLAGARMSGGVFRKRTGLIKALESAQLPPLDLYEHLLPALAGGSGPGVYLARLRASENRLWRRLLTCLFEGLRDLDFRVSILPYCDFFHIGSTAELLANIGTLSRTARTYGFANFDRSVVADSSALEGAFVFNSALLSPDIAVGAGSVLESVHAGVPVELMGRNLVVGLPSTARVPLRLPEGWGIVCLPVRGRPDSWTAVSFGVDDDFKTPVPFGGTFGNRPMNEFVTSRGLRSALLWPHVREQDRTLWNARLWVVGTIDAALRNATGLTSSQGPLVAEPRARRVSIAQLLGRVDQRRLLTHRAEIQRVASLNSLGLRLKQDRWGSVDSVLDLMRHKEDPRTVMTQIDGVLNTTADPLAIPRLYRLALAVHQQSGATLPSRPELRGAALAQAPFAAVARVVARQIALPVEPRPANILHDQVVWATCPVRIDLSGGWSDTPPICNELGGTVLNAAITLNGQYPVQVVAKLSERRRIRITSLDLGEHVEITRSGEASEYLDPSQWTALPKAALVLSGACPADPSRRLSDWLEVIGGGLDITLFSAVPKGSGLGTSSIIGATMIACLARVFGESLSRESLIARTSLLEQMMTTAGGWQDQIGGIVPGVKLIRTDPGLDQRQHIHWVPFDLSPDGDLLPRLLLYYTGHRRMARNILQNVVGRYLARDPQVLRIVPRLKELAEKMTSDLAAGDVDSFGAGVGDYWSLKKDLDRGATNRSIESILRPIERYLTGKCLPGAGGGGFVFMVARDPDAAQCVRRILQRKPPNQLARFFDFDVDGRGLSITVL